MRLILIAAVARNRGIGIAGALPWHLPDDLRRFKSLTTGHTVIMGRRTWESIGRPLPNRRNIVITSHPPERVESYPSLQSALTAVAGVERVFVIGGGALYAEALFRADELLLTRVDRDVPADTFFPPFEHLLGTAFRLVRREEHGDIAYEDYTRISSVSTPTTAS